MIGLINQHPTLANDPAMLVRLAIPKEVMEGRAVRLSGCKTVLLGYFRSYWEIRRRSPFPGLLPVILQSALQFPFAAPVCFRICLLSSSPYLIALECRLMIIRAVLID